MAASILCPLCRLTLSWHEGEARCPSGHHFDRARAGYVNLLPTRPRFRKRGDDEDMVRARRAFLDLGHYRPLAEAIAKTTVDWHESATPLSVVDAGCGDGYYLDQLAKLWRGRREEGDLDLIGFDVAKGAVRLAARRLPQGRLFVADIWRPLLFADGALDVVLNCFAPRNPGEYARIVRQGGLLQVVIPGPGHLARLRQCEDLLSIEPDKESRLHESLQPFFSLAERKALSFPLHLEHHDRDRLLAMMPRPNRGRPVALRESSKSPVPPGDSDRFVVDCEFVLLAYRRRAK